jgi:hypothetical protein
MTTARLQTLLAAAGIVLVSALVEAPLCSNELQRSDSADYLRAVRGGALGTYLDTNSVTFPRFVSVIRDRALTDGHPWEYLSRRSDAAALRHFHVPVGFYASAIAASYDASERIHRILPAVTGVVLCGLVVLLMRRLGAGIFLSVAAALVIAVNARFAATVPVLSPHPWYILAAFVFLVCFAAWLETSRRRLLLISMAALAVAFASMELAPALVLAALPATFIAHPEWLRAALQPRRWWRDAAVAGAVFAAVLFVAWPGGVLRGGYLVSYAAFVAQALFKRGEMFLPLTWGGMYQRLFDSNPILVAVSVGGLFLSAVLVARRRAPGSVSVFGLYAAAALVLNAGNGFTNSSYAAEAIVFLLLTAGIAAHYWARSLAPGAQAGAALAGCLLIGLCAVQEFRNGPVRVSPADALELAVRSLPSLVPGGTTVLVNRSPQTYAAYLPGYRIEATTAESSTLPSSPRLAGTPDYLVLDVGPLGAKNVDTIATYYCEVARFQSRKGGSDIVLWRRQGN